MILIATNILTSSKQGAVRDSVSPFPSRYHNNDRLVEASLLDGIQIGAHTTAD